MKRLLILAIMICCPLLLNAQGQVNIWYFGINAGLDFNSGYPKVLTDGQINTGEGVATISDPDGNLLFYTDGISIWDRRHEIMPNGMDLRGSSSSTQSATIVQLPGNPDIFYLFTVANYDSTSDGFRYSIVDMKLNNGYGDITSEKNELLYESTTEKIVPVLHDNKEDIWVIMHEWDSDAFRAYLITESGLDKTPVISNSGSVHTYEFTNKIGYMKASPKGEKIVMASTWLNLVELYDFNRKTGVVSNSLVLSDERIIHPYGVEFSSTGSKLYVSTRRNYLSNLYQFDMEKLSSEDNNSPFEEIGSGITSFGALQTGPDRKIYLAKENSEFLGVIHNPDLSSYNCNFVCDEIYLGGRMSMLGLPSFKQSFFLPRIELSYNGPVCQGLTLEIDCSLDYARSYSWTGPDGFTSDQEDLVIEKVELSQAGLYTLVLEDIFGNLIERSIEVEIHPSPLFSIEFIGDHPFCVGDSVVVGPDTLLPGCLYEWLNGTKGPWLTVKESGRYFLKVTNELGCSTVEVVDVWVLPFPEAGIIGDDRLCTGSTINISADKEYHSYLWSTGETSRSITVDSPGRYTLYVANEAGCDDSAYIDIKEIPSPEFEISGPTEICDGESTELSCSADFPAYKWSTGDTTKSITVSTEDYYGLTVTSSNGCTKNKFVKVERVSNDIKFSIPDTNAGIGSRRFRIPVYAESYPHILPVELHNIVFEFTFDELVISDEKATKGLLQTCYKDGKWKYRIKIPRVTIDNPKSILTQLECDVVLSDSLFSSITLDRVYWDQHGGGSCYKPILSDGSLQAGGLCQTSLCRVTFSIENELRVSPNPIKDFVEVSIESCNSKMPELSIINSKGIEFYSESIKLNNGCVKKKIDTEQLPAGLYFIILRNREGITSVPVIKI